MQHAITSLNTKKTLSSSLKKLMAHKPLAKISVTEIITDCGLNRKTFYYHFADIYDLLKWTLEQEAVEVVKNFDLMSNPEEALVFIADYVDANSHILNCAYNSMGRDEMKRFFCTDFYGVILSVIEDLEEEKGVATDPHYKEFMVKFFAGALAEVLIDYFQHKDKRNRDELIHYTMQILKGALPHLISPQ